MNKIITTHVIYRSSTIPVEQLKEQSNLKVIVECKHGQREVRWCRRNALCRQCCVEAGLCNTSKPGRVITWGDKISKAKKGIKATDAHKKALSVAQYDIDESEWKGFYDKSDVAKIRDSIEYREFRERIMERDDFKCQLTGMTGRLEVHHIIGVSKDASKILDMDNAITLHENVHDLFHSEYGNKKNTAEQFEEFKKSLCKEPDMIVSWLKNHLK
jgi:hypothetical protein